MSVTTQEKEYKRLRSYLNPYIKGPNVDAVLNALAIGNSSYLINNAAAINDQLYIATASGEYLDQRLADYGIIRPPNVGLSDDVFRQIGIQVKNRKQVRDLINNLLNAMFGDEFVRASNKARQVEPYNLSDGDTLIINFDESHTVPIIFKTSEFQNINAALAQEISDAITATLRSLGFTGTAITNNDGNGNYVEILSDTIGAASSVTILGGSAQNELQFDATVPAGGNASTQWSLSLQPGGFIRFTWTAGANPQLSRVSVGNYANVFGGGFSSSPNEGSFTIAKVNGLDLVTEFTVTLTGNLIPGDSFNYNQTIFTAVSSGATGYQFNIGANANITAQNLSTVFNKIPNTSSRVLGSVVYTYTDTTGSTLTYTGSPNATIVPQAISGSYFEVENPLGTSGVVVQGTNDAVLFYNPVRKTLISLPSYAIAYQTQARLLQIFIPAATKVVRRSRIGSAHLHDPANFVFTFNANANPGDLFAITTLTTLVAGVDFAIGGTAQATILNMVPVINALGGMEAIAGNGILTVWQDSPSITLVGTYTGIASIVSSGILGDPLSVQPDQLGPYMFDLTQPFTISDINTTLTQNLDATSPKVFTVTDASQFPNSQGYLIFGYGTEEQEGPVPYTTTPSSTTILINPSYTIKKEHLSGTTVSLISQNSSATISIDGLDYPFYMTDVVAGRIYAQDLIQSIAATGINVVFTILYPNSIGLGKWHTPYDEIAYIYGP